MPQFIIERNIDGASTLTPDELADIAATSNEVVANLGGAVPLDHQLRRRRQGLLRP